MRYKSKRTAQSALSVGLLLVAHTTSATLTVEEAGPPSFLPLVSTSSALNSSRGSFPSLGAQQFSLPLSPTIAKIQSTPALSTAEEKMERGCHNPESQSPLIPQRSEQPENDQDFQYCAYHFHDHDREQGSRYETIEKYYCLTHSSGHRKAFTARSAILSSMT